jgi:hypothetical protein
LSTSATTAIRISVAVTPISVAFGASFYCAPAVVAPVATTPAVIRTMSAMTLGRFTGSPLV